MNLFFNLNPPGSIKIIPSKLCTERRQFRFPVSKKRRIRRKWAKRPENFRDMPTAFLRADTLICHPSIVESIKRKFTPILARQAP